MWTYALRGVWHYRRIQTVVLLAVAISTAVIGGSLIVGDSVRYSLRQLTESRLGDMQHVLHSPRFVRQELTGEIAAGIDNDDLQLAPGLMLVGSVERRDAEGGIRRAGNVTTVGITDDGWNMLQRADVPLPGPREVVLGFRTAKELEATVGDQVSLWLEIPESIPRDSLLGERDEVNVELVVTVADVLPETAGASRFDLNPGQQLPNNAFLNLLTLQQRLGLEKLEASRRNLTAKPARINTIFAAVESGDSFSVETSLDQLDELKASLKQTLQLEDIGLSLKTAPDRNYVSIETDSMILESSLADSITQAVDGLGLSFAPTAVYLANEIYATDRTDESTRYSMYSIVAGVPAAAVDPLGPFGSQPLKANSVQLSAWLAEDLKVQAGDSVTMKWHPVGSDGTEPEIEHAFTVSEVLPPDDPISVDQSLTPTVEGITDVDSFSDWDQPFPMDMDRITERDDDYWTEHRATPKAFIPLPLAHEFWSSRYGENTSIRVATAAPGADVSSEQTAMLIDRLASEIRDRLQPRELGIGFRPVRLEGMKAAVGANDFTGLFIGFSFFLILSAVILAALMFRLGIQRRVAQLGLMKASGWTEGRCVGLFLREGLLVAISGVAVGVVAAVGFAKLMIYGLTTWWIGAVGTRFLQVSIDPVKLAIAAACTLLLVTWVMWRSVAMFRAQSVRSQLAGRNEENMDGGGWLKRLLVHSIGICTLAVAVAIPVMVLTGSIPEGVAFEGITWSMVCFFGGGFSCLVAGLYLLRNLLAARNRDRHKSGATSSLRQLAFANAARNPSRSLMTTALIAFATFVIVAVAAGRRNPLSELPDKTTGNGGFTLVAEAAQPILTDLNDPTDRKAFGISTDDLPDDTNVFGFGMKPGVDASCVNLYQATVPTLLGAETGFIERGGFRFSNAKQENPWSLLADSLPDTEFGDVSVPTLPVIGDANTLQYSLKKRTGDVIAVPNDESPEYALKVVGMLDGSVFQGVLVTNNDMLKAVDHEVAGHRYFLLETPLEHAPLVATAFESSLNDYGFDAELVNERISGFLAVQNTYLSTFQLLGGLGLLVGTFGLAAVMIRNVTERRSEIALLRALGFTTKRVGSMVLFENNALLLWGIVLGTGSALLAMSPHLRTTGGDLPWQGLAITLGAVAITGMLGAMFAVKSAVGVSIRENLAAE